MTGAFQVQIFIQPAAGSINWRLLSGNNRSAGMGAFGHDSIVRCRVAIRDLQRDAEQLTHRMRRTPDNRWAWELRQSGHTVAVAGHTFDRLGRCEHALAAFLLNFRSAPVSDSVLDSAARRWATTATRDRNSSPVHARTVRRTPTPDVVVPAWPSSGSALRRPPEPTRDWDV